MDNNVPVRISKIALVASAAFFSSLVVFNNFVDYQSNFLYVMHVMSMDTTGNEVQAQWRALPFPWLWHVVYALIIAFELLIALLCWLGVWKMFIARNSADFCQSKTVAIYGLTLGVVLWFLAFMGVSGEWFLAWQSKSWSGIQPGFRVACLFLLTLIYVTSVNDSRV